MKTSKLSIKHRPTPLKLCSKQANFRSNIGPPHSNSVENKQTFGQTSVHPTQTLFKTGKLSVKHRPTPLKLCSKQANFRSNIGPPHSNSVENKQTFGQTSAHPTQTLLKTSKLSVKYRPTPLKLCWKQANFRSNIGPPHSNSVQNRQTFYQTSAHPTQTLLKTSKLSVKHRPTPLKLCSKQANFRSNIGPPHSNSVENKQTFGQTSVHPTQTLFKTGKLSVKHRPTPLKLCSKQANFWSNIGPPPLKLCWKQANFRSNIGPPHSNSVENKQTFGQTSAHPTQTLLKTSKLSVKHRPTPLKLCWKQANFRSNIGPPHSNSVLNKQTFGQTSAHPTQTLLKTSKLSVKYRPTPLKLCWKQANFLSNIGPPHSNSVENKQTFGQISAHPTQTLFKTGKLSVKHQPTPLKLCWKQANFRSNISPPHSNSVENKQTFGQTSAHPTLILLPPKLCSKQEKEISRLWINRKQSVGRAPSVFPVSLEYVFKRFCCKSRELSSTTDFLV